MARPALVLTAMLLPACATLSGRSQFVAVDSELRGVEVRDAAQPEKLVGVTPFFLELPRASGYVWSVRAPNAPTGAHVVDCGYRWGETLLAALAPGMIATAATPIAGAAVVGALTLGDLVTGAAWQCPLRITVPSPRPPEGTAAPPPKSERCATLALVPPAHPDEAVSRQIARRVQASLSSGSACVKWVPDAKIDPIWQQLGVAFDTDFDLDRFERSHLNALGHATGATHLVIAAVEARTGKAYVQPRVHDLFTLAARKLPELTLDTTGVAGSAGTGFGSVSKWASLVPNAASFSVAFKNDRFEGTKDFRVTRDGETGSSLPSTLSNWSLGYIDPPGAHGRYDLTLRLSPEFLFGYNERRLHLEGRAGGSFVEDVSVLRLIVAYGPTLALYTPLGEFSGGITLGGGLAADWTKTRDVAFDAGRYANASINFTSFVSENVFVRAGVQLSVVAEPIVARPDYSLSLLEQTNVTVGYMLPGLRTLVRSGF